jgi:succinate dehydrogenase / fumarate reductase cytochrome b subunit
MLDEVYRQVAPARAGEDEPRRPLSPHLQIYRLPVTALLSITHRFTGVLLTLGLLVLVLGLMAAAAGPSPYVKFQAFLVGYAGRTLLWLWLYALFFHLCHGVRHLVWDTGNGFAREHQHIIAYLEIAVSLVFTLAVFLYTHFL